MKQLLFILTILLSKSGYSQSPLCPSTSTQFGFEYMANITINNQLYQGNTGYSGPGYYDYTSTPIPSIEANQSISISFTAQTKGNYRQYFKLWIDFNGNGDLNDPGELVYSSTDSWTGTRNFNSSFTVPPSVFNGEVYARFIMVFSSSPTLCGNYSYGNTFDFKTTITGAQDPFSFSGHILNSEGSGVPNMNVDLFSKVKSASQYSYLGTFTTDSTGFFNLTSSRDANTYDFQLAIDTLTIPSPSPADAKAFTRKVLLQDFTGRDYYRMDVNDNSNLTITDVYLIFRKISGESWGSGVPAYRIITPSGYLQISQSSSDLSAIYNGEYTAIVPNLKNKDSTTFYLIRTGYRY